ncbi:MAG: ABC transporter substrate-binding protein [Deltaproteobacteria bacterium]|nr:ABC transporter substrate-binding protein [Deltaproteobacteria bacterium]
MSRGYWRFWIVAVACIVLLGANQVMAEGKVLKVGVLAPLTGPSAETGQQYKSAVTMAMEKIGYKVGDYKLDLVWIDSQSDPAKASAAYAEAVERGGIQVGLLDWNSSTSVAVMDVAAHYKIPHMFSQGATELVNQKYKNEPAKYSYWGGKGWPIPGHLMKGYVETLNKAIETGAFKPAKKTVAIYGEDTDWGRSACGAFKQEFKNTGWEVISEDYFPTSQTDFYPLVSKYKKAGVAAVAGTSTSLPSMTAFIKQSQEVGLKSIIIADGLGWVGDWYKLTGEASDGVVDMIPQLASPQAKEWAKAFEAKFQIKPSPSTGGIPYDLTNFFIKVLGHALNKYSKLDKETIYKVMVEEVNTGKLTYSSAEGAIIMKNYRYDATSFPDPVLGPDAYFFPIIQYNGGKGEIVYPPDMATKKLEVRQ